MNKYDIAFWEKKKPTCLHQDASDDLQTDRAGADVPQAGAPQLHAPPETKCYKSP